MKILAVVPAVYNTSPGQRFRIEQWAPHLERDGCRVTYAPFEDDALHRVLYQPGRVLAKSRLMLGAFRRRVQLLLSRVSDFDVVYLFREGALAGPPLLERLLAARGVPVVYDFDDAVWVPYVSPSNKYLSYLKCFGKTRAYCRMSKCVMAGNPYLAEYAARYCRRVEVVPTTIDTDAYQVRQEAGEGGPVTIGWTGSYSTVQHLDTIRSVLLKLRERVAFRLEVIGTPDYRIEGLDVVSRAWRPETEVADLQRFDVGLMPLPDDTWSRGKCGLKLLQCMAVGVPVVGSPVGVNSDIIREGVNGRLAATEGEWVEKLAALIRDAGLRRRMGLAGRKDVEERYSARVWAPKVRAIFESVAAARRRDKMPATAP